MLHYSISTFPYFIIYLKRPYDLDTKIYYNIE